MALKLPDQGCKAVVVQLLDTWSLDLHLFANDLLPDSSTKLADLVEANFDGYSARAIGAWSPPAVTPDHHATRSAPAVTWTCTGASTPNSVYGYFVLDPLGNVVWLERFAGAPYPMAAAGQQIIVTPTFSFRSET